MQNKTITIKFDERALLEHVETKAYHLVALRGGQVIVIPKQLGIEIIPACVGGCDDKKVVQGCPLHDPK